MGYYIEAPTAKGKAKFLRETHGAVIVKEGEARTALAEGKGVVCVVDNGPFEAAGFCFDFDEFDDFADPKYLRFKTWLVMDRKLAETLSNFRRRGAAR